MSEPCPKCGSIHWQKPGNGEVADCLRAYIPLMTDTALDLAIAREVFGWSYHVEGQAPPFASSFIGAKDILDKWQDEIPQGNIAMSYVWFAGRPSWRVSMGPSSWHAERLPRAISELALFLERCEKL